MTFCFVMKWRFKEMFGKVVTFDVTFQCEFCFVMKWRFKEIFGKSVTFHIDVWQLCDASK